MKIGEKQFFWESHPKDAKRLGRQAPLREDWEEIKLQVMEDLLRQKFSTFELKSKLLATGDEILIEGNWWGDRFWGAEKTQVAGQSAWVGENHLGKLLMKIREEIILSVRI